MAQVQSRKSNFYSQKQSIRDELSAPTHLESAGDVLIKHLARKQTNTCTSLREQLEIVQNFEKGFELNPENRKGVTCLEEFKKHMLEHSETAAPSRREQIRDLDGLMKFTGLTRHELELGLSEKPNSTVSRLYMFAIGNKRRNTQNDTLASKWCEHPINRLKEIEEECFGQPKKANTGMQPPDEKPNRKHQRRNKHRKRKRKPPKGPADGPSKHLPEPPPETSIPYEEKERPKAPCPRPSLWDVKDMKTWAETKQIGCRPPALYTIRDGQIIKLGEGSGGEDIT